MRPDATPAERQLAVRRSVEFVRALVDFCNDVIGHGPEKLDYFRLIERDLGKMAMTCIWRIIEEEDARDHERKARKKKR